MDYHTKRAQMDKQIERATLQALPNKRYCLNNYTIQCKDETSGSTGCFLFDTARYEAEGKFYAVSPVYSDLVALYANTSADQRKGIYLEYKGGY